MCTCQVRYQLLAGFGSQILSYLESNLLLAPTETLADFIVLRVDYTKCGHLPNFFDTVKHDFNFTLSMVRPRPLSDMPIAHHPKKSLQIVPIEPR